jgi:HlyD family secretion protein
MPRLFKRPAFWIVVLIVLGGGAFAVTYVQAQNGKKAAVAKAPPPESPYMAVVNGKADVEGGIIAVAARRGGIVRDVLVQEGDFVKKGQILARQEDDEARLALARANAQVEQARSQVAALEVQLSAARRERDRMQKLAATNTIAAQKLDESTDSVRDVEARLNAQKASIAVTQASAAEAAYNLELTVIRAPVDGQIIRRYANPGAGASTLNVSTMFDLEPKAPRIVRAEVTELNIPNVFIGQDIEIVPESDNTKSYPGKVLRRAGLFGSRKLQSDDASQRTDDRVVEVVVSADAAPLLVGQRVLVKFKKQAPQVAAAPSAVKAE